jgi:hypothetical protein
MTSAAIAADQGDDGRHRLALVSAGPQVGKFPILV